MVEPANAEDSNSMRATNLVTSQAVGSCKQWNLWVRSIEVSKRGLHLTVDGCGDMVHTSMHTLCSMVLELCMTVTTCDSQESSLYLKC